MVGMAVDVVRRKSRWPGRQRIFKRQTVFSSATLARVDIRVGAASAGDATTTSPREARGATLWLTSSRRWMRMMEISPDIAARRKQGASNHTEGSTLLWSYVNMIRPHSLEEN